jgi:uncharacterized membrane protein
MMKQIKIAAKFLLAFFFVAAGVNHFRNPEFYLRMMPPQLPFPSALHLAAGFFEVLLGLMLLFPKYQRRAAWGMIALLIAVFPANIYMAMNPQLFPEFKPQVLMIRLPFQFVFIAWAWWFTRTDEGSEKL